MRPFKEIDRDRRIGTEVFADITLIRISTGLIRNKITRDLLQKVWW